MARLEAFRGLKLSKLESFRALKFSRLGHFLTLKLIGQIGGFKGPGNLGPQTSYFLLELSFLKDINNIIVLDSQGSRAVSGKH